MDGAIYVSKSCNSKLSKSNNIDCTYLTIKNSCPTTCALRNNGCYGENSYVGIISRRLDRESEKLSALEIAKAEAKVIDNSYNRKGIPPETILRLHVSGDSRTVAGSKIINKAIGRWINRGGKVAFSYSHCWKNVNRDIWNNVSMLASIDSIEDVDLAVKNGYACTIVVADHLSDKFYRLKGSDIKWVPCPAQVKKISCIDCKLCFNADKLYNINCGIVFSAHGIRKNIIKKRLSY